MTWNWQQQDWPHFTYDNTALEPLEASLPHECGVLFGACKHLDDDDKTQLTIEMISNEAQKTSEIEGEHLNRDSLHSSIRRHFGLATDNRKIPPAEQGMVDLYQSFREPLSHDRLYAWHGLQMPGRRDIATIGRFRTGTGPMQVVSGPLHAPRIHFEAPPSGRVEAEMDAYIRWFNATAQTGQPPLPILARAGIAHLYFVTIHPFEDGNERIGRALSEKALAQGSMPLS
jgi:Fic family protein